MVGSGSGSADLSYEFGSDNLTRTRTNSMCSYVTIAWSGSEKKRFLSSHSTWKFWTRINHNVSNLFSLPYCHWSFSPVECKNRNLRLVSTGTEDLIFFLNTEKRNLFLRLSAGEHVLVAEYKVHHECRIQVSNPSNSTTVFAGLNPSVQIRIPSTNSMAFWIRVRNTDHHPGTGYLKKLKICFF